MTDDKVSDKSSVRLASLSPEHMRLSMVQKMLDGPATLTRISREQMFVEALCNSMSLMGTPLPATHELIMSMRTLSPGKDGLGRDEGVKMLSPVPQVAIPGSAFKEEKGPGLFSRIGGFITGNKPEEK